MAYSSFAQFVQALEQAGELTRVSTPVETDLIIAAWADREMKSPGGGKALLFEQPLIEGKPSKFPLAINTMGSQRRMALALKVENVDEISREIQLILKAKPPTDLREGWSLLKQGIHLLHARPKHVKDAACQEVVHRLAEGATSASEELTLRDIPILKCWPKDGGKFSRSRTCTRVIRRTAHATSVSIACRFTMSRRRGCIGRSTKWARDMASVTTRGTNGCRSRFLWAAIPLTPSPRQRRCRTDWMRFSSRDFCARNRSNSFAARRSTLRFPPMWISCSKVMYSRVRRGPRDLSAITRVFIPLSKIIPIFHLTAITHRRDAIYPTTIVGIPPMEDFYLGDASVRIFLPVFRMNFPELVDMALPSEGVFHNLVFVSIRKQYPYQAFKVMHGLWGMGQMMFSKYIVVVDEDCDVHNTSEVLFRLCANTDPQRDSTIIKNPSDSLDHAPSTQNVGSHMGFDATRKLRGEGYSRDGPNSSA